MDEEIVIEVTDPRRPEARAALTNYLVEVAERIAATTVDASDADDVDEFVPPGGAFVLVRRGEAVVGCGAVWTMAPGAGELKRMWISPDERGKGLGGRLLSALIERSRALGHTTLQLDTNDVLTTALAMYHKYGFEPIDRYNDNPDANYFLRKTL